MNGLNMKEISTKNMQRHVLKSFHKVRPHITQPISTVCPHNLAISKPPSPLSADVLKGSPLLILLILIFSF